MLALRPKVERNDKMKIIVIGGVAAGMSAASKIIRDVEDVELIVLEKTSEVSYGACGLPYYISNVNDNEDLLRIRTANQFKKTGIDVRLESEAVNVDFEGKKVKIKDKKN